MSHERYEGFELHKGFLSPTIAQATGQLVLKLAAEHPEQFAVPTYRGTGNPFSHLIEQAWLKHPEARTLQDSFSDPDTFTA